MPLPEPITPCNECGGERIAAEAGGYVTLTPFGASLVDELLRRVKHDTLVCIDCGAVSWYTRKPLRAPARE